MTERPSEAERRRVTPLAFWTSLVFSILTIGYLIWKPPTVSDWRDWIIVGGAIFWSIMAIVLFQSIATSGQRSRKNGC